MEKSLSASFEAHFAGLEDPRIKRKKLYPLIEILFVVLCGMVCGAQSWRDFVSFGNEKLDFLKLHFAFINGIPSKNTFARVFYVLDPEAFRVFFSVMPYLFDYNLLVIIFLHELAFLLFLYHFSPTSISYFVDLM